MARRATTITALFVALLLVLAPAAGAVEHADDECGEPLRPNGLFRKSALVYVPAFHADVLPAVSYAGENEAAATRVRKAFLKAKKAFHEARRDICSIKKGEKSSVHAPSFFDDEA